MATITLTISGLSASATINAANTTRILNAFTAYYQRGRPGQALSNQDIVNLIGIDVVQMMKDRVKTEERATAEAAIVISDVVTT